MTMSKNRMEAFSDGVLVTMAVTDDLCTSGHSLVDTRSLHRTYAA